MSLLLTIAAASLQPVLVPTFGAGALTCQEAFTMDRQVQAESWILGYWTGLNMQPGGGGDPRNTSDAVLNAVKESCSKTPAATLLRATQASYRGRNR